MQCPGENTLALFLDGRMSEADSEGLRAYLAACADCASLHELLRAAPPAGRTSAAAVGLRPTEAGHGSVTLDSRGVPATAALPVVTERPRPGLLVGGRYRLERLLGEGGMGSVRAAEHVITRQRFAPKLVRHALAQKPSMRRRMLREAKAASAVRHPNVVRVLDVLEAEGGTPVLVMDLLVGETLRDRVRRGPLGRGTVSNGGGTDNRVRARGAGGRRRGGVKQSLSAWRALTLPSVPLQPEHSSEANIGWRRKAALGCWIQASTMRGAAGSGMAAS
jgi:hypothetical protein